MTTKRCPDCRRIRDIRSRGRCATCYDRLRHSPGFVPGTRGGANHVGFHDGSLRQIAAELKISHVTVKTALAKGRLVETEAGWEYTPGVPGRPRK